MKEKLDRTYIRTDARTMWRCFTRSVVDYGYTEREAIEIISRDVSDEIKRLKQIIRELGKTRLQMRQNKNQEGLG